LEFNFLPRQKDISPVRSVNGRLTLQPYLQSIFLRSRKLEDENDNLRADKEHLHREIKKLRRELDELVYEDNVRNDDYDNLQRQIEVLQLRCEEFASKESELSRELKEKTEQAENFLLKEEGYRHKIKCMETHSTGCDDDVGRMKIRVERMLQREKQLEKEILGHVKTQSETEQQNTLMYHTIETLKRNNETCNSQRVQLQQENKRLQEKISKYEQQNADCKSEVELRTENNELRRKQDENEDLKCALQSELFILKRRLDGHVSKENSSPCKSNDTNEVSVNSESPLNINNQQLKQNESDFNAYLVGVNEQQSSISCADMKIFAQKKEEEIELLLDQRTRYQEECRLLEEEVLCLKANYEAVENKLDEHNLYIDDLATQCSRLQEQIGTRNNLIHQQEEDIEQLRLELDDHLHREKQGSKSINEIQEYSLNLNRELAEKNREIENLRTGFRHFQQETLKTEQPSQDSNILLQQQQDLYEEIQDLKQRIVELEEENFDLLQHQLPPPPNASSKSILTSSSIDPELESSSPVLAVGTSSNSNHQQSRIRELENEVDCLRQNISQQQQFVDYSFEDEHLVSRERYLDQVESVRNKELIISDLQEHINLLESECASLNAQQRIENSIDNEMESPVMGPKLGLRLPSPDIAAAKKETFSFHKKRNSLPPLPTANANSKQSRPAVESKGMREKRAVNTGNAEEMRGKVIRLNAELLEKKMLITKLEDDLKTTKRRFTRLEESHR